MIFGTHSITTYKWKSAPNPIKPSIPNLHIVFFLFRAILVFTLHYGSS